MIVTNFTSFSECHSINDTYVVCEADTSDEVVIATPPSTYPKQPAEAAHENAVVIPTTFFVTVGDDRFKQSAS
jgi:hypothetical protein